MKNNFILILIILLIFLFGCTQPREVVEQTIDENEVILPPDEVFWPVDKPSSDCGNSCIAKPDINSLLKEKQLEVKTNLIKVMQSQEQNFFSSTEVDLQNDFGFQVLRIDETNNTNFNTFDDLKQFFFESMFLSGTDNSFNAVNKYVADKLRYSYFLDYSVGEYGTDNFYSYNFSVGKSNQEILLNTLNTSIQRAGNNFEFITINNCSENACEEGTITLNYPLSNLTDSEIDLIPKIIATDMMSGDGTEGSQKIVGSVPIFEKKDLKIKIPLRFFKAMYEARKYAINLKNLSEQIKGLDCKSILDLISDVTPTNDSLFEKIDEFNSCKLSIAEINIDLVFKESNPLYIVSPDDQNKIITENNYKMRITKEYPSN